MFVLSWIYCITENILTFHILIFSPAKGEEERAGSGGGHLTQQSHWNIRKKEEILDYFNLRDIYISLCIETQRVTFTLESIPAQYSELPN